MKIRFMLVFIITSMAIQSFAPAQTKESNYFVPEEHPEIMAKLEGYECAQGVPNALADAGANWKELWSALEDLQGTLWADACWLITNMPHLDRLEMTRSTLLEHVRFAYATRTQLPYKVPQELYREYILTYRIADEPVRPWRAEIWFRFPQLKGDTMLNTARRINAWVAQNLTVRERGFFGPQPDPLSVIQAGSGTEADIAMVAIAMCKTFGVAARQVRVSVLGEEPGGKTWLEVYSDDGRWVPMYPHKPEMFGNPRWIEHGHPHNVTVASALSGFARVQVTDRYTPTASLILKFTRNGEPLPDFEHFSVSVWNDGAWLPLDDLFELEEGAEAEEEGFKAVLGDGFYVVQAGMRNARGDVFVKTFPVSLEPGAKVELVIPVDIPLEQTSAIDLIQRNITPLPESLFSYEDPTGDEFLFPRDLPQDNYALIVIFDPSSEPSARMLPLIARWSASHNIPLYGVGVGEKGASQALWELSILEAQPNRFFTDPAGTIASAFGYSPNEEGLYKNLPLVMLLDSKRNVIFLVEGYNLSVTEGLSRALELSEG